MWLSACAGKSPSPTQTTAGPGRSPSTAPTTPSGSVTPGSATPGPGGPATITFGRITFHAPANWQIDVEGDTAYVGVLAGGPADVNLRVIRNFTGSIDALKPTICNEAPDESPSSVQAVESGFRPVGDRTAQFRLWRAMCARGSEEHRAWVLPDSQIAIYEQVHEGHPENVDVVTRAEVAGRQS